MGSPLPNASPHAAASVSGDLPSPEPGDTLQRRPPRSSGLAAVASLIGAWAVPAATARRTHATRLWTAWLLHLSAMVLTAALILLLVAWPEVDYAGPVAAATRAAGLAGNLYQELSDSPAGVIGPLLGFFILIELIHLGVAVLMMPWGARDEPMRSSFKHAMRQTWLHSSHFLAATLVIGGVVTGLDRAHRSWRRALDAPVIAWPRPPDAPVMTQFEEQNAEAMARHQAALAEFQAEYRSAQVRWDRWNRQRPWYLRYDEELNILTVFATVLWILWALMRAVGAARPVSPIARPPTCARCGYNLFTLSMEGRCPECGEPVAASIGPHAVPGAPWEHRRSRFEPGGARWWAALLETGAMAVLRPRDLGRRLRVAGVSARPEAGMDRLCRRPEAGISPLCREHRRFFGLHLPVIFLLGAVQFVVGMLAVDGLSPTVWCPPLATGALCCLGAVGLALASAWSLGAGVGRVAGRNLMPASMQMACYLGTYLVVWQVVGGAVVIAAAVLGDAGAFRAIEAEWRMNEELATAMFVGLPMTFLAAVYLRSVYLGTSAARYANR